MNKYAFENIFGIQGFNIAWYGVIIACGMLLGVVLATQAAKRRGYKTDLIIDFIMLALPVAIVCARAYYVIFEWSNYSKNLIKIFAIWEGGLAIYGGFIGGVIAALVFSKMNKLPFWELIDIAVPSLILGQAIGRWGNFVNQEAYGNLITNPSLQFFPYGVFIQKLTQWHQATFFYESMWNLLIFIVLILYKRKAKYNGDIFARYLIGYGTGRWVYPVFCVNSKGGCKMEQNIIGRQRLCPMPPYLQYNSRRIGSQGRRSRSFTLEFLCGWC